MRPFTGMRASTMHSVHGTIVAISLVATISRWQANVPPRTCNALNYWPHIPVRPADGSISYMQRSRDKPNISHGMVYSFLTNWNLSLSISHVETAKLERSKDNDRSASPDLPFPGSDCAGYPAQLGQALFRHRSV